VQNPEIHDVYAHFRFEHASKRFDHARASRVIHGFDFIGCPTVPIVAKQFERMGRTQRVFSAGEIVCRAIFVATPADALGMAGV